MGRRSFPAVRHNEGVALPWKLPQAWPCTALALA